ncbi:hypothetical protein EDB85DRAFT_1289018 [Lactarius pseudohatsudake]|nr:hypothetical protein EDB85DRAFT_1289018 [Lactarius pseudohatsudake]
MGTPAFSRLARFICVATSMSTTFSTHIRCHTYTLSGPIKNISCYTPTPVKRRACPYRDNFIYCPVTRSTHLTFGYKSYQAIMAGCHFSLRGANSRELVPNLK